MAMMAYRGEGRFFRDLTCVMLGFFLALVAVAWMVS